MFAIRSAMQAFGYVSTHQIVSKCDSTQQHSFLQYSLSQEEVHPSPYALIFSSYLACSGAISLTSLTEISEQRKAIHPTFYLYMLFALRYLQLADQACCVFVCALLRIYGTPWGGLRSLAL
jgi:hypothetical protein